MANDLGIRVEADVSELGTDNITTLTQELLAALGNAGTVTMDHNNSYSVGTSVDNLVIDIGAGGTVTEDWAFRVMFDSTVSKNKRLEIYRAIISVCLKYTIDTIVFDQDADYADGTGTFQLEATIT